MPVTSEKTSQAHRTAYLDGLRGVASLVVLVFHTLWSYCGFVEFGYGDGPQNLRLFQLPFLRLAYAGHAMVCVFFVVGGYVMALKPLRLTREARYDKVGGKLARSMLRKSITLYAPGLLSSFLAMVALQAGLWEYPRQAIRNPRLFNYPDEHPLPQPTLAAELARWLRAAMGLANLVSYINDGPILPYYNPYDPHLWTLPFELRASLVVALTLVLLSRCRRHALRIPILAISILICGALDRWECVLFLFGTLLAFFNTALGPPEHSSASLSAIAAFVFIPALYLLSAPNLRITYTPGYTTLAHLIVPPTFTDPKRAVHGTGAVLLVLALARCPALQRPFLTKAAQAAGRRAFALYLLHGPLVHIIGYSATVWLWRVLGYDGVPAARGGRGGGVRGAWGAEKNDDYGGASTRLLGPGGDVKEWIVGFAGSSAVLWCTVWWVSGWWERRVERGCREFARWVEERCFAQEKRDGEGILGR